MLDPGAGVEARAELDRVLASPPGEERPQRVRTRDERQQAQAGQSRGHEELMRIMMVVPQMGG